MGFSEKCRTYATAKNRVRSVHANRREQKLTPDGSTNLPVNYKNTTDISLFSELLWVRLKRSKKGLSGYMCQNWNKNKGANSIRNWE